MSVRHNARQGRQGHQGQRGRRGLEAYKASPVRPGHREDLGKQVLRVQRDRLDHKDVLVSKGHRASQGKRVHRADQGNKVQPVHKDRREKIASTTAAKRSSERSASASKSVLKRSNRIGVRSDGNNGA